MRIFPTKRARGLMIGLSPYCWCHERKEERAKLTQGSTAACAIMHALLTGKPVVLGLFCLSAASCAGLLKFPSTHCNEIPLSQWPNGPLPESQGLKPHTIPRGDAARAPQFWQPVGRTGGKSWGSWEIFSHFGLLENRSSRNGDPSRTLAVTELDATFCPTSAISPRGFRNTASLC